jgi:6-phosphogluconate dehydrogenase (decarboxylating)
MFSWYDCSDGSELLTDEDIMNTFAVEGGTWTVQRSMDQGAPEAVVAETVTFAGTE